MDTVHPSAAEPILLHLTATHSISVRVFLKRTHCPMGDRNQVLVDPAGGLSLVSFSTESCPFEVVLAVDSDRRIRKDIVACVSLHDAGQDFGSGAESLLPGGLRGPDGAGMTHIRFAGQKRRMQSTKFGLNRTSFRTTDTTPHAMRLQIALAVDGAAPQAVLHTPAFFVLSKIPSDLLTKDYVLRHLRTRAATLRYHIDTAAKRYHPSQKRATVFFHLATSYPRLSSESAHVFDLGSASLAFATTTSSESASYSSSPSPKRQRQTHSRSQTPPLRLDANSDLAPAAQACPTNGDEDQDTETIHEGLELIQPWSSSDIDASQGSGNAGNSGHDDDNDDCSDSDSDSDRFDEIIHKHTGRSYVVNTTDPYSPCYTPSPNSSSQAAHLLLSLASATATPHCTNPPYPVADTSQTSVRNSLPVLALIASVSRTCPRSDFQSHSGFFFPTDSTFSSPTTPFCLPPIAAISSGSSSIQSFDSFQSHAFGHMM